jgi:hypothetical protein
MSITRRNHGNGHSYSDENGAKIPGVTTLINDGFPKKALQKWAGEVTADYYLDHRDELAALPLSEARKRLAGAQYERSSRAAARGSKVHKLAERIGDGEVVAVPEGLEGYVHAAVSFLDDFDVQVVEAEFTVYSESWRWAGTPDLIADLIDADDPEPDPLLKRRVRWLLDYKTKDKESAVYGDVALQLAAYRHAEKMIGAAGVEEDMIQVDRCGIVQLYADGTYRLVPVTADESEFLIFSYVQQIALWADTNRRLVGDPIDPPRVMTPDAAATEGEAF